MGYTEDVIERIRAHVKEQGWECAEKEEGQTKRLDIQYGRAMCCFKVYSIEAFAEEIDDEANKKKFKDSLSSKSISKVYEDFVKRFKSCKSKPADPALAHDLET